MRKRKGKWESGRLEVLPQVVSLYDGKRAREHDLRKLDEIESGLRGAPLPDFEKAWAARTGKAPRKASAWVELGDWCRLHGLETHAQDAYREALALDTDQVDARRALGWLRRNREWVSVDDVLQGTAKSGHPALLKLAEELREAGMHEWETLALAALLLESPRDTAALEHWLTCLRDGYAPALSLGAPFTGRFWAVPDATRHHALHASSAFALDFVVLDERGRVHEGAGTANEEYAGWGAPLLAVADGRIVRARDHLADDAAFQGVADPARANDLVLRFEGGQAFYQHLQQGSLRVEVGDEVQRGQELGRVGNSGNASYPHLHFAIYEWFEALGRKGWITVPVTLDAAHVVGRRDAKEGKTRAMDLRCRHVPLQEGWEIEVE